jgi:hypothetical protein
MELDVIGSSERPVDYSTSVSIMIYQCLAVAMTPDDSANLDYTNRALAGMLY